MRFIKYHALGNDYIVIDAARDALPTPAQIARICHRNYGPGSDGILWGPMAARSDADFALRIFNPDGGEAQKSGNGLRIFCRYLFDTKQVDSAPFSVWTQGGIVQAQVFDGGASIQVEMGQVRFQSTALPMTGPAREAINETIVVDGESLTYSAASVGNPHCVVTSRGRAYADDALRFGPKIETDARFPERTNVQFLEVIDRSRIKIEIWERGAGYTLASGSSSSAAAAVAHRLGWVDSDITVCMPGGELAVHVAPDYSVTQTGPVSPVCEGVIFPAVLELA